MDGIVFHPPHRAELSVATGRPGVLILHSKLFVVGKPCNMNLSFVVKDNFQQIHRRMIRVFRNHQASKRTPVQADME